MSHHRHIIHLFSYALSPSGRADLACHPTVDANPQETGIPDIAFPKIPEVDAVIRRYFPAGTNLDREVEAITAGVKKSDGLDLKDDALVTCQAIVFHYHEVQPRASPDGMAYLLHRCVRTQLRVVLLLDLGLQRHAPARRQIPDAWVPRPVASVVGDAYRP